MVPCIMEPRSTLYKGTPTYSISIPEVQTDGTTQEYICNPDLAHDFWSIEWVKSFEDAGRCGVEALGCNVGVSNDKG